MTIEIGFVDGNSIIIENVCPMNRLVSDLQKADIKDVRTFIVINDTIIALDKVTYIKEVKLNEDE